MSKFALANDEIQYLPASTPDPKDHSCWWHSERLNPANSAVIPRCVFCQRVVPRLGHRQYHRCCTYDRSFRSSTSRVRHARHLTGYLPYRPDYHQRVGGYLHFGLGIWNFWAHSVPRVVPTEDEARSGWDHKDILGIVGGYHWVCSRLQESFSRRT